MEVVPSGSYSSRSAYAATFIGQSGLPGVAHLWKAKAPSEHKFFMWLAIHDRCWTNDQRQRHGLSNDASCILCQQQTETIDHLIIACMFSREVWFTLLQKCGRQALSPAANDSLVHWWIRARETVTLPRRATFDFLVLLVARVIWLQQNERTFSGTPCGPAQLVVGLSAR
jgi:hypothetical protein